MQRKRLSRVILLILLLLFGSVGWIGYRAVHQSALDHALIVASRRGDPLTVRTLLDQGADPNASEDSAQQTGWRHLLQLLLRRKQNRMRLCPLGQALALGEMDDNHVEIVRLLLTHHANPNAALPDGTPIPMGALEVAENQPVQPDDRLLTLFLQHGVNLNTVDSAGTSLLMFAANARKNVWVRALLEHGAKPDIENPDGDDALMWAAYHHDVRTIGLLLSHGADVNHKNKKGVSALMYSLVGGNQGQFETTKTLLAAGADVNAQDYQGCSPFLFALATRKNTSSLMLAHGGDLRRTLPPSVSTQNITVQIHTGNASMTMGISFSFPPGTTPLMLAVSSGDTNLVRSMLAKGAEVNARDPQGQTALDYAKGAPTIQALLQHAGARE